jgi:hypothetical protein
MKTICNDGAGHANLDAEGTESESDTDDEKEFNASTGKKRNYASYHTYPVIKEWVTGPLALLKDAKIKHEIYTEIKKYLHA